jgi:arsenate reductase-like glutaredoxin family protein
MMFLGLSPKFANYKEDPIPDDEMNELINSTNSKIHAVNQEIQERKEMEEKKEQKKYEEAAI